MSQITGTTGDDFLTGTADADQIDGLDGHDFIRGEGGNKAVKNLWEALLIWLNVCLNICSGSGSGLISCH